MTTQQLRDDFFNHFPVTAMTDTQVAYMNNIVGYWLARMKEQEEELVKKIIEDYGTYNDGCGCCSDYTLRDKLRIYFNIIKNN